MRSILHQLSKYQPQPEPKEVVPVEKVDKDPYVEFIENCTMHARFPDPDLRDRALKALKGFVAPANAGKLYPVETAILYFLFYNHSILICPDAVADGYYSDFLKSILDKDGSLDAYLLTLKDAMDDSAIKIFLHRVMVASLGEKDIKATRRDYLDRDYGIRASKTLKIEPTIKAAWIGLESLNRCSIEQSILGRIAYIAFWEACNRGNGAKWLENLSGLKLPGPAVNRS